MDGILAEQKLFLENKGLEKKGARDEDERAKENGRRRRRRRRRRRKEENANSLVFWSQATTL
jgi:hypothetical protein